MPSPQRLQHTTATTATVLPAFNVAKMLTPLPLAARPTRPWIEARAIHNALAANHFLDLLSTFPHAHAYPRDVSYPDKRHAGVYAIRMRALSREYTRHVSAALVAAVPGAVVSPSTAADTAAAVALSVPLLVAAPVEDPSARVRACVPALLRYDVARSLFPTAVRPLSHDHVPVHDDVQHPVTSQNPCHPSLANAALQNSAQKRAKSTRARYVPVIMKRRSLKHTMGRLKPACLSKAQAEIALCSALLTACCDCDVGPSLVIGLNPDRTKPIALATFHPPNPHSIFDPNIWTVAHVLHHDKSLQCALHALQWLVDVVDHGHQWLRAAVKPVPSPPPPLERADISAISNATSAIANHADEAPPDDPASHHSLDEHAPVPSNALLALAATTKDIRCRPNMKCAPMSDWPWTHAKRAAAEQLRELTLLSGVGQKIVADAMSRGLPNDYADVRISGEELGVKSQFVSVTLAKCKPTYPGPAVTPALIPHNKYNWRALQDCKGDIKFDKLKPALPRVEQRTFYIDFELASPEYLYSDEPCLADGDSYPGELDTQPLPRPQAPQDDASPESLIFMIGCGQVIQGEWRHKIFTSPGISKKHESSLVRQWLEYVGNLAPDQPFFYVWGPEQQLLSKAFSRMTLEDAAAVSHLRVFKFVNMLQVASSGCLSVQGALRNSIKAVVNALEKLGLLRDFGGRPALNVVQDGSDAMALALDALEYVRKNGLENLVDAPNMKLVASYNEADCRDIARLVAYLRENH